MGTLVKGLMVGLVVGAAGMAGAAGAATLEWADATSGRGFALLEGKLTWWEASRQCHELGYALFDMRYLNADEQKSFLDASALDDITWERSYVGTPRESAMGRVWQASSGASIAWNGASFGSSVLLLNRKRTGTATALEWWGADEEYANAACMSVDNFWYTCNAEWKCVERTASGEISFRQKIVEEGPTQAAAMAAIVRRTEDPAMSISTGTCSLLTESTLCTRLLP